MAKLFFTPRLLRLATTRIRRNLNLKVFLPLLLAALLMTWYGLFVSVAEFSSMTAGLAFMDMQPTLQVGELFEQIRSYDAETRQYYLWWSLFDCAWPFVTFTTMLFIAAWLFSFFPRHWQHFLPWLLGAAYATVLMDWLENLGFSILVVMQPAESLLLANITVLLHAAKLFFNMLFNLGFWPALLGATVIGMQSILRR
jgi:hypothetical protein